MIDFLIDCGIDKKTINRLEDVCSKETLYSLYCNEYNVKNIIDYFKTIGIECIDDILVNYPGIFIDTLDSAKNLFKDKNISLFVKMINNDYRVIGKL